MKRLLLTASLLLAMSLVSTCLAQTGTEARRVLDKTASVIGRKGGAKADFTLSSPKVGSTSGTICIKGKSFHATTPQATVWFNGKTQWTYMKKTDEVNVSTPTQAQQMAMNPYTFINMYKSGYTLGMTTKGNLYVVHLVAQNKQRSVQEMYIHVNKASYVPSKITMRQGNTWSEINIRNFTPKDQPNSLFTFNAKDYPTAEIIDLR